LLGRGIGERQPRGADIHTEHRHHGFGGAQETVPSQQPDELNGTELLVASGLQVAALEGRQQAVVDRRGEIVGAATAPRTPSATAASRYSSKPQ